MLGLLTHLPPPSRLGEKSEPPGPLPVNELTHPARLAGILRSGSWHLPPQQQRGHRRNPGALLLFSSAQLSSAAAKLSRWGTKEHSILAPANIGPDQLLSAGCDLDPSQRVNWGESQRCLHQSASLSGWWDNYLLSF